MWPFFTIMIICSADERYEITKNVLSDDWVLLTIKKKLNRSIERGSINGNFSVAYPFSYYVYQSQYSSLQMMHFNLKRYLRNPHASFVYHFHHNYGNTRLGHIVIKIRFTIKLSLYVKNTPKTDIAGLEFNVQPHWYRQKIHIDRKQNYLIKLSGENKRHISLV